MYFAAGLAIDGYGMLYLADTGNNTIRVSTFIPPRIHAVEDGSSLVLSWRNSAPNYSIQTTSNITDSSSWVLGYQLCGGNR